MSLPGFHLFPLTDTRRVSHVCGASKVTYWSWPKPTKTLRYRHRRLKLAQDSLQPMRAEKNRRWIPQPPHDRAEEAKVKGQGKPDRRFKNVHHNHSRPSAIKRPAVNRRTNSGPTASHRTSLSHLSTCPARPSVFLLPTVVIASFPLLPERQLCRESGVKPAIKKADLLFPEKQGFSSSV